MGIHYNYDTNHCVLPKGLKFKTEDDDYSVILREGFKVENGKIVDEKTKNPEKVERISAKFLNGISDKAELQKAIPELFHDGDLIDGEVKDANYRLVKKEGDKVYVEFDNNKNGLPDGYDIIQNGKIIQGGSNMFSNSSYSRLDRLFANPENDLVMTDEDRRILKEKYSLYDNPRKFDFNFYSGNPVVEKVINFTEIRSCLASIMVYMDRLSDTKNGPDDVKRNTDGLHQALQEYENSAHK